MQTLKDQKLSSYTTLGVGGPAPHMLVANSEAEIVEAMNAATPALVMGGGSNLVIGDGGVPGEVLLVRSRGISFKRLGDRVQMTVVAGHPWVDVVDRCVEEGFAGVESLAGIPGTAGATPIQNVGAYGHEVSELITSVRVWDCQNQAVSLLGPDDCEFKYRSSMFKRNPRYIVLEVTFTLAVSRTSAPVNYSELAGALGIETGRSAPIDKVRDAVIALRRAKGMVLDPADPDSVSVGSFFTNPILEPASFTNMCNALPQGEVPPKYPDPSGRIKTSAAWLIDHAGFGRGYGTETVGISTKHTLAIVNKGGASAAEVLAFAGRIREGVADRFGIWLEPEPVLVGCSLPEPTTS